MSDVRLSTPLDICLAFDKLGLAEDRAIASAIERFESRCASSGSAVDALRELAWDMPQAVSAAVRAYKKESEMMSDTILGYCRRVDAVSLSECMRRLDAGEPFDSSCEEAIEHRARLGTSLRLRLGDLWEAFEQKFEFHCEHFGNYSAEFVVILLVFDSLPDLERLYTDALRMTMRTRFLFEGRGKDVTGILYAVNEAHASASAVVERLNFLLGLSAGVHEGEYYKKFKDEESHGG